MLVMPQLSAEIEKLLPATQAQLTQALQTAAPVVISPKEIESILFSIGDISLLVKRAQNIMR
jgi:hypothetical protein